MNRALILFALLLASCNTVGKPKPVAEPIVVVQEVRVPVAVPCDPDIGPDPAYLDSDAALAAAGDLFDRVKLLLAGRGQRIGRDAVKTAALDECRTVPPAVPPQPG